MFKTYKRKKHSVEAVQLSDNNRAALIDLKIIYPCPHEDVVLDASGCWRGVDSLDWIAKDTEYNCFYPITDKSFNMLYESEK